MSAPLSTVDREIVVSRLIHAPRELVFACWKDIAHISAWWGPEGFRTTTLERDFRPGGQWRFIMHGPDGRDYPNRIYYSEIVEPEYIQHLHSGDEGAVQFRARTTFEEQDGGTLVTLRSTFASAEERDRVAREYGAAEGARQTLARLAQFVEAQCKEQST